LYSSGWQETRFEPLSHAMIVKISLANISSYVLQ
jgi:hypothetical protein